MNHFKLFAATALVILSTSSACAADYVYVTKDNVNLRNGASSQSKIVGKARLGMVVRPLAAEGDWTKVQQPISEGSPRRRAIYRLFPLHSAAEGGCSV